MGPWWWMRLEKPELNLEGQVGIYEELAKPQEKIPGEKSHNAQTQGVRGRASLVFVHGKEFTVVGAWGVC